MKRAHHINCSCDMYIISHQHSKIMHYYIYCQTINTIKSVYSINKHTQYIQTILLYRWNCNFPFLTTHKKVCDAHQPNKKPSTGGSLIHISIISILHGILGLTFKTSSCMYVTGWSFRSSFYGENFKII